MLFMTLLNKVCSTPCHYNWIFMTTGWTKHHRIVPISVKTLTPGYNRKEKKNAIGR